MSGLHKEGLGWNALGVYCGECDIDDCTGCKYEYKPFQGFSSETVKRLRKEINEDNKSKEPVEYVELKSVLNIISQYCPDDDGTCSKANEDLRNMLDEIEGLETITINNGITIHKKSN